MYRHVDGKQMIWWYREAADWNFRILQNKSQTRSQGHTLEIFRGWLDGFPKSKHSWQGLIHTIYPGYNWRIHLNSDLAPGRSSRIGLRILYDSGKLQETLKNLNMEASTNGGSPIAGWFTMENPLKKDLGISPCQETVYIWSESHGFRWFFPS